MSSSKTRSKPKKYANPVTGEFVADEEALKDPEVVEAFRKADMQAKFVEYHHDLDRQTPVEEQEPKHKLPEGMNRNNSVQDFLMVIIQELWRIEDKLDDKT